MVAAYQSATATRHGECTQTVRDGQGGYECVGDIVTVKVRRANSTTRLAEERIHVTVAHAIGHWDHPSCISCIIGAAHVPPALSGKDQLMHACQEHEELRLTGPSALCMRAMHGPAHFRFSGHMARAIFSRRKILNSHACISQVQAGVLSCPEFRMGQLTSI